MYDELHNNTHYIDIPIIIMIEFIVQHRLVLALLNMFIWVHRLPC